MENNSSSASRKSDDFLELAIQKVKNEKILMKQEIEELKMKMMQKDEIIKSKDVIINDHKLANNRLVKKLADAEKTVLSTQQKNGELKKKIDAISSQLAQTLIKLEACEQNQKDAYSILGKVVNFKPQTALNSGENDSSGAEDGDIFESSHAESSSEDEASIQPRSSSDSGRNSDEDEVVESLPRVRPVAHASALPPVNPIQENISLVKLADLRTREEFPVFVELESEDAATKVKLKVTGPSKFNSMFLVENKNERDVANIKKIKTLNNRTLTTKSKVFLCSTCGTTFFRAETFHGSTNINNHIKQCK